MSVNWDHYFETGNSIYRFGKNEKNELVLQRVNTKKNNGINVSLVAEPYQIGKNWKLGENREFILLDKKGKPLFKTTPITNFYRECSVLKR